MRFSMRKFAQLCVLFVPNSRLRKSFRDTVDRQIVRMFRPEIDEFIEKYPNVLTEATTLERIIEEKRSIARFGDGEFKLMVGERHKSFQDVDLKLIRCMQKVLESNDPRLLVAMISGPPSLAVLRAVLLGSFDKSLWMSVENSEMMSPDVDMVTC